ncbi:hypothetical protein BT69DRAFT_705114 [Atractiella rhizophila]|nr:hypothetical protein BT69DRAFT_705114 [Atractiella rhizophila]
MSLEDDQERAGTSSAGPSCSKKQSPASTSRWKTVRPWKPMDDFKDKYQLEVIEVGPTAVALALYSPTSLAASRNSSRRNSRDSSDFLQVSGSFNASTPDARDRGQASLSSSGIVVKVNSQPWACVSHAGSAGVDDEWRDASMVVVVWNLEPGKEYRVELDVLENVMKETDADKSAWTMVETTREHEGSRRPVNRGKRKSNATMSHQSLASSSSQSHDVRSDEIEDAPPPYSAVATPEPEEDESQLRAILKSLRASHKQAESVLKNSIATLKKSLDKANKDDIRTRQRITQLEEGIKKSRERASLEIPREMEVVEDEIKALQEEESRLRKELERRSRNVERTQGRMMHQSWTS